MNTPVTPEELLADPTVLRKFQEYAIQFMMVKDVDNDIIIWVNKVAAKPLGVEPDEISGAPSSKFYPDHYKEYHEDDLEIVERGTPRLQYLESFTDEKGESHQLVTNKWPLYYKGTNYVAICALDITTINTAALASVDHGRAYDFTALDVAMEKFEALGAAYAT